MASNYEKLLRKLLDGHGLETIRNWVNAFFVRKDGDRVLSDNNYTDKDKEKVDNALQTYMIASDEEVDEMLEEVFNPAPKSDDPSDPGSDPDPDPLADDGMEDNGADENGLPSGLSVADDSEVDEMLNEVFGKD